MSTEVRLNETQVCDAWAIYFQLPVIHLAQNAFNGFTMQSDPIVELISLQQVNSQTLTYLINEYYKPYLMEQRKWYKVIGVHPFYFEKIRGTDDYIPRTPSVGSGYIAIKCGRNNVLTYQWVWNDTGGGADTKVYFNVGPNAPLCDGTLVSPIMSLLKDWKTTCIVRDANELVSYQQSHQQFIFEHHPPRNVVGDDNLTTLEEFGDTVAQTVIRQQETMTNFKFKVKTDALYDAVNDVAARNYGMKKKYGKSSFINSEGLSDTWERQNASLVERGIPLKTDFYFKSVPQPHVTADFKFLCHRLDYMAAFVMDFPLQLIESSSGGSNKGLGNFKANIEFLHGRIKDWCRIYEESIKRVIIMVYGTDIGNLLKRMNAELSLEISVHIPVQPKATLEELQLLHTEKVIDSHDYREYSRKLLDLPNNGEKEEEAN